MEYMKNGYKNATAKSIELLEEYQRHCRDKNVKASSLQQNMWTILHVLDAVGKPIEEITGHDLSDYFFALKESGKKDAYVNGQKAKMKAFLTAIKMKKLTRGITLLKRSDLFKLPKHLVDRKDLLKILQCCENDRDRALIFTLYESGARRGEILAMKKGDLMADEYGFVAVINGKTGERRIRLIESTPDIKNWLQNHPSQKDPESLLWASLSKNHKGDGLHKDSLNLLFVQLGKKAGLQYKFHPHLLRHSRATELASIFTEVQLCKFFGWEIGSPMPRIYVSRSGVDIDDTLLVANGVKKPERKGVEMLKAKCPACGEAASPAVSFCYSCGALLNTDSAKEVKKGQAPGIGDDLEAVIKTLEKFPGGDILSQRISERMQKDMAAMMAEVKKHVADFQKFLEKDPDALKGYWKKMGIAEKAT